MMLGTVLHAICTVVLGPLLLAQGKFVRRITPLLPEPEGKRSGVSGKGPMLRLLITGDSAGAGVGCRQQCEALLGQLVSHLSLSFEVHYLLEATTGNQTQDCINTLQILTEQPFDVVVTSLGVNDVTSLSSANRFEARQRQLIALLRQKFSAKQVILSGVPPMRYFPALPQPLRWYLGAHAQRLDAIVQRLALEYELNYVSLEFSTDPSLAASDGFHPGPAAYALWADSLAAQIL